MRLTERDQWLLEAIGKMRFATTGQLTRLFFESRSAANKRLRRLLDAGLVRVWLRTLAEENVYSITQGGLVIAAEGDPQARELTVPRRLAGNLSHLLAVGAARVAIAMALPRLNGELCWWRSDWEFGSRRFIRVNPDALFAVRWRGVVVEELFSLEVERHTSGPRSVLKKILRYVSLRHQSEVSPDLANASVLVVGDDPRRLDWLRHSIARLRLRFPIWFARLGDLVERGPDRIWREPGDDQHRSLREVCFLPYRKEGFRAENDVGARCSTPASPRIYPAPQTPTSTR